jgi:hypothetical protein
MRHIFPIHLSKSHDCWDSNVLVLSAFTVVSATLPASNTLECDAASYCIAYDYCLVQCRSLVPGLLVKVCLPTERRVEVRTKVEGV